MIQPQVKHVRIENIGSSGELEILGVFDHDAYNQKVQCLRITAEINSKEYSLIFPIKIGSPNKPLVVGFPGYLSNPEGLITFYGAVNFTKETSDYSIITINDREGFNRDGSWYLGKEVGGGLFSYQILINLALKHFQKMLSPSKTLFFGTSMGGFGALMHSSTCMVDEVYLCVPQSSLNPSLHYFRRSDTDYSAERSPFTPSRKLKSLSIETPSKFMDYISKNPFLDISRLSRFIIEGGDDNIEAIFGKVSFAEYYHIISSRYDHSQDVNGTYFKDMILPIFNSFAKSNVRFSSSILPFPTHDSYLTVDSVCAFSDNVLPLAQVPGEARRTSAADAMSKPPFWRPMLTKYI